MDKTGLMIVFGGKANHIGSRLNDLWIFNISDELWLQVITNQKVPNLPCARSGHGLAYDNGQQIFLFGGRTDDSVLLELNDMWVFSL